MQNSRPTQTRIRSDSVLVVCMGNLVVEVVRDFKRKRLNPYKKSS
jgi:hypothetical protein